MADRQDDSHADEEGDSFIEDDRNGGIGGQGDKRDGILKQKEREDDSSNRGAERGSDIGSGQIRYQNRER